MTCENYMKLNFFGTGKYRFTEHTLPIGLCAVHRCIGDASETQWLSWPQPADHSSRYRINSCSLHLKDHVCWCSKPFFFFYYQWKWNSLSHVWRFATHGLYNPWNSPGQNPGMGSCSPSPGHLLNPGIKPRSPTLQADSLPAEQPGKPENTGVGSLSLLQGIFPSPGIERGSPGLQADSLPTELSGKPDTGAHPLYQNSCECAQSVPFLGLHGL